MNRFWSDFFQISEVAILKLMVTPMFYLIAILLLIGFVGMMLEFWQSGRLFLKWMFGGGEKPRLKEAKRICYLLTAILAFNYCMYNLDDNFFDLGRILKGSIIIGILAGLIIGWVLPRLFKE